MLSKKSLLTVCILTSYLGSSFTVSYFIMNRNLKKVKAVENYPRIERPIDKVIQEAREFKLQREEEEKQRKIEEEHKEQERIKAEEEEQKRKDSYNIEFNLTYYSRSPQENGGYNCTKYGTRLREGIVASNYWKRGTIIELQDGRRYVVEDTGSSNFDSPERLDVFVDTYDRNYVSKLGKTTIKGRVIKG